YYPVKHQRPVPTSPYPQAAVHTEPDSGSSSQSVVQQVEEPAAPSGAYASQQAAAKAAKLGLWKGSFEEPWTWRAEQTERSSQPLGIIGSQAQASGFSCQPKRTCSQIGSCEEAEWYLSNCPWGGKLDRDKDGIPCESLC
ncbi:excalibur calcium-binding domain-containing protein, partial [Mesorhizobium sp. P5_C1]